MSSAAQSNVCQNDEPLLLRLMRRDLRRFLFRCHIRDTQYLLGAKIRAPFAVRTPCPERAHGRTGSDRHETAQYNRDDPRVSK